MTVILAGLCEQFATLTDTTLIGSCGPETISRSPAVIINLIRPLVYEKYRDKITANKVLSPATHVPSTLHCSRLVDLSFLS